MKATLAVVVSLVAAVGFWMVSTLGLYIFLRQIVDSRLELSWLGLDASLDSAALWISQEVGPAIGGALGIVVASKLFPSVKISALYRGLFYIAFAVWLLLVSYSLDGLRTGRYSGMFVFQLGLQAAAFFFGSLIGRIIAEGQRESAINT